MSNKFTTLTKKMRQSLFIHVFREIEKSGVTRFALTAPGPIAFFNLDKERDNSWNTYVNEKRIDYQYIRFERFIMPEKGELLKDMQVRNKQVNLQILSQMKADIAGVEQGDYGTIVIDGSRSLYHGAMLCNMGREEQIVQYDYGSINIMCEHIIRTAVATGKNLVVTSRLKEMYKNNKPSGIMGIDGYKQLGSESHVNIELGTEDVYDKDDNYVRTDYIATIINCAPNPDLRGLQLYNDEITFETIRELIYNG